jgi:hypothetical protein
MEIVGIAHGRDLPASILDGAPKKASGNAAQGLGREPAAAP